ncbi:MAG: helix-turn-helix domain-containing protein, partial [Planctomycetota bacterium]
MMYTTAEAARQISVCKNTLLRWVYEGLIPDVGRDWRGWRSWSQADINRAKA